MGGVSGQLAAGPDGTGKKIKKVNLQPGSQNLEMKKTPQKPKRSLWQFLTPFFISFSGPNLGSADPPGGGESAASCWLKKGAYPDGKILVPNRGKIGIKIEFRCSFFYRCTCIF